MPPDALNSGNARWDASVHLWAKGDPEAEKYPYAGQLMGSSGSEPPMEGHADLLLQEMQTADVNRVLVVQPGNHMFDHSYMIDAMKRHPGRFIGCLLANPAANGEGLNQMRALIQQEGFKAVRFNPYLWPEGEKMYNQVGRELYKTAGELGAAVGFMTFKGLLGHIDEIEALCTEFPQTPCIMDHFGFCKTNDLNSEEWSRLLGLARFPQVFVKASALFRVSQKEAPYDDVAGALRLLVDRFGAERIMWGSDWPWVREQCGFQRAWQLMDEWEGAAGKQLFSPEERAWIFGGSLRKLLA